LVEKRLTLFTAPKPFKDPHISVIQTNALKSWQALGDQVEIIVLGADEGVAEKIAELGIRHIPQVACNDKGTPLISSMIDLARQNSSSPYLCIVNTDIILFPDLLLAMENTATRLERFLIIGQRWDMDVTRELPAGHDKFAQFKKEVFQLGELHPPMGSDYFLFPRECYQRIPDLAIGRAGWDNWFIFKSRFERWAVIDASHDVTIVHQNHDYRHLPGGQPHYRLPETRENVVRGGGEQTIFTIADAQYDLVNGKLIQKPFSLKRMRREVEIFPLIGLKSMALGKFFFYLFHPKKAYQALRGWVKDTQR
jgi:hypothetical protein